MVRTISLIFVNSLSDVTATDWTRNLSLHFASKGGSTFMAWRRTVNRSALRRIQHLPSIDKTYQQPQPPFLARFFLSWDAHSICIIINNSSQARRGIAYCFGAVVLTYRYTSHQQTPTRPLRSTENLTLKATGVWLPFLILRTCDTSLVKGPVHTHQSDSSRFRI